MARASWLALIVWTAACGKQQHFVGDDIVPDGCGGAYCDLLMQTGCMAGEKCAWVEDTSSQCGQHERCVPDGSAALGQPCAFGPPGPAGYDNCVKGAVCSAAGGSAVCRQMCNLFDNPSTCDATHACFFDDGLSVVTGDVLQPSVCLDACDPLADNDFDGSGSALTRSGSACGSATIGCLGFLGTGTSPPTRFGCAREEHYDLALRHRTECTVATGCERANDVLDYRACNQGYMPLLTEATGNTTSVCIALCKPVDCYAGNCGSNNIDRLGAAPHRCMPPDAVGNFGSGEECRYFWWLERDPHGRWPRSPFSDTLGFCFDHTKYRFDPNGGSDLAVPQPGCEDVPLHGSGSGLDAVSLGCVSSATAGL